MNKSFQREEIKRFVSLLSEHKINEDVILIGSWATYFYQSIWPKYQAIIRTTDIDFYTGFKIGSAQTVVKALGLMDRINPNISATMNVNCILKTHRLDILTFDF